MSPSLINDWRSRFVPSGAVVVAGALLSGVAIAGNNDESLNIQQSRGVDQRVDYSSLTKFGPWDDRNYKLVAEDLEVLSPEEDRIDDPIPAFFRVELRKEFPELRKTGPAQYPRSAVPLFQQRYGGLQRDEITLSKSSSEFRRKGCDEDDAKASDISRE